MLFLQFDVFWSFQSEHTSLFC